MEPSYHVYHIEHQGDQRTMAHCSLCRDRSKYLLIVSCALPPQEKRGCKGGRKEIRLCAHCLRIIRVGEAQ